MEAFTNKKTNLFLILGGIFITNVLLAELAGMKIFSLERTLGLSPAQLSFFSDQKLDFNLTAGVVMWPIVFITTDIINEYFGKKGVKQISILTALCITYAFFMIWLITCLPSAQFWLDLNSVDSKGNHFNFDEAYNKVFLQSMGAIVGSLVAFLIGQLLDVATFVFIRKWTGKDNVWLRATGSTLVSQFVDSFVVLIIAFYWLGNPAWSFTQVISVGLINYIYKFFIAISISPLLYVAHYAIELYLGTENAQKMSEEASKSNFL